MQHTHPQKPTWLVTGETEAEFDFRMAVTSAKAVVEHRATLRALPKGATIARNNARQLIGIRIRGVLAVANKLAPRSAA